MFITMYLTYKKIPIGQHVQRTQQKLVKYIRPSSHSSNFEYRHFE